MNVFHLYMHPILGDILPDDVKVSGVIKCGEFDTPLETPFHVIREFGLECLF